MNSETEEGALEHINSLERHINGQIETLKMYREMIINNQYFPHERRTKIEQCISSISLSANHTERIEYFPHFNFLMARNDEVAMGVKPPKIPEVEEIVLAKDKGKQKKQKNRHILT